MSQRLLQFLFGVHLDHLANNMMAGAQVLNARRLQRTGEAGTAAADVPASGDSVECRAAFTASAAAALIASYFEFQFVLAL